MIVADPEKAAKTQYGVRDFAAHLVYHHALDRSDLAGTVISVSALVLGSSSLLDFAESFSANAGFIWLRCCARSTTKEAGAATMIAIAGPRPIKQKTAGHIVLDILEPKVPPVRNRMGANLQA